MKTRDLVPDVWAFLDQTSDRIGRLHAELFSQRLHSLAVSDLESPIEDRFLIACAALCDAALCEMHVGIADPNGSDRGFFIQPQARIDQYRVDFLLTQYGIGPEDIYSPVIVELDGHDFHDKDKRQRSYEKARDRHLVKRKYRVLHFTGSDIVADPFRAAHEALDMAGVFVGACMNETYNPQDPLSTGG